MSRLVNMVSALNSGLNRCALFCMTTWGQICLMAFFALVRLPFVMWTAISEPDQGRFFVDAYEWIAQGGISDPGYRYRTSPLYICLLSVLGRIGGCDVENVITLVTLMSFLASLGMIPMLIALCKWHGFTPLAALSAVIIMQIMPNVWFGSLYGFPTMLATAMLLGAVLIYDRHFFSTRIFVRIILLLTAWAGYAAAGLLKIDVLLCGGAFAAIAILRRNHKPITHTFPVLFLFAAGAYFAGVVVSGLMPYHSLIEHQFWSTFNSSYGLMFSNLLNIEKVFLSFRGQGVMIIPLCLIVTIVMLIRYAKRGNVSTALVFLLWPFPLLFFYQWYPVCVSREVLNASAGIAFFLGCWINGQTGLRRPVILAIVVVVGLLAIPPSSQTFFPSARVIKSSFMYRAYVNAMKENCRAILEFPESKILVVGEERNSVLEAYCVTPRMSFSSRNTQYPRAYHTLVVPGSGGQQKTYLFHYGMPPAEYLKEQIAKGFVVTTLEPWYLNSLQAILGNRPELRGPLHDL